MTPTGLRFRPPWWGVLLAAAGCAAGIALGEWQSRRADEKRAAAGAPSLVLRGEFLPAPVVFLDNKLRRGRPGYEVVQPFRIAGDGAVLVNRGWVAAGPSRQQLPQIRTPAGEVRLAGVRRDHFARAYEPSGAKPQGAVWINATPERFTSATGLALEAWVFEQHSNLDDGLVREWPAAEPGAEKNEAYAFQWYALAALSAALLIVLGLKREKTPS
jgi:surfeit locus 1 family protein